MQKAWLTTKRQQAGFSAVEVLLAATVFGVIVTALIGAIVYGRASTANTGDHQQAMLLAEEGLEAVRNIGRASFANLTDNTVANVGDTAIESGFDYRSNGTTATRAATGTTSGTVTSVSVYIKTIENASLNHVQVALYADASGTPGARLGASAVQTAVANSWNTFSLGNVTVAASTNYWLALSEDGPTEYADLSTGGTSIYHATNGYPAPDPFAADTASSTVKPSFYMTVASSSYGLSSSGGQWAFSGTSDTSGVFTRKVTVSTSSTNRKAINCTVTWTQQNNVPGSVTLTTEITNWAAALKLWSNAIVAGSANPTGTLAGIKVATAGNYAYLVENGTTNNFVIVNISNPASPSIVSTTTVSGTPTNIAVSGSYAYITTSTASSGLLIYNVGTPATPSLTKTVSFTGTGGALGVFVNGNYAYVVRASDSTTGANEFNVVNVTTPASASVVGGYNPNIQVNEVWASGNYAYVATSSTTQEMLVINVTTPTAPTLAATYNPSTTLAALTVTGFGNTVYLGMSTTLDAINVTTPTAPARLGTFTAAGTINDAAVDITGQFGFLATSSTTGEFQAVTIGTPASMTLAKTVDVSGTTSTLNGVAYNPSLDAAVGASASTTQRLLTFTRN